MKIFVTSPNENWVLDRFKKEWIDHTRQYFTNNINEADALWFLDGYSWQAIPQQFLAGKKVIATVHHVVPEKFSASDFLVRDQIIDYYHVPCEKTKKQIEEYTDKPILVLPFWVNDKIWIDMQKSSKQLRKKYNLPQEKYLVGSFQRDTEGHDLKSPKLEKGPDLLCDFIEKNDWPSRDVEVVLSGWRRQYVISRLEAAKIKYHFYEMCDFKTLNELYNCLDLYVVSSRYEGGPQAIMECAITKTPIISTNVGLASRILAPESIASDNNLTFATPNTEHAYNNVIKYIMKDHIIKFRKLFERIINE